MKIEGACHPVISVCPFKSFKPYSKLKLGLQLLELLNNTIHFSCLRLESGNTLQNLISVEFCCCRRQFIWICFVNEVDDDILITKLNTTSPPFASLCITKVMKATIVLYALHYWLKTQTHAPDRIIFFYLYTGKGIVAPSLAN